jgi:hypothetical protein
MMAFELSDFLDEEEQTTEQPVEQTSDFSLGDFGVGEDTTPVVEDPAPITTTTTTPIVTTTPTATTREQMKTNIISLYDQKEAVINKQLGGLNELDITDNEKFILSTKFTDSLIELNKQKMADIDDIDDKIQAKQQKTQEEPEISQDPWTWDNFAARAQLGVAGVRRVTQGLALELAQAVGADESAADLEKQIAEREAFIRKTLEKTGQDPDAMFNTANLSQLAFEIGLPLSKLKGIIKPMLAVGGTTYAGERGKGEDKVNASITAGMTAATVPVLAGGAWLIPKVGKAALDPIKSWVTGISTPANLAAKKVGLTAQETKEFLKDVPKEDQTRVLAEAYPDLLGNLKQAVGDSDQIKIIVSDMIQHRTNEINKATQKGDFGRVKLEAEHMYGTMKETLESATDIKVNMDGLSEGLSFAKKIGGDETAISKIKGFENQIKDNPNMTLSDAIDLREGINDLIRKSKGKAKKTYKTLLDNLDEKITKGVPAEYKKFVDESVLTYRNMKQQQELIEIIRKSSKFRGEGGVGEKGAVDYNKVKRLIAKEGLNSPETKATLEVVETFQKKFGNDYEVFGITKSTGVAEHESALGFWGNVGSFLKRHLWRVGEYGQDIKIQKALKESLKDAKTPVDFVWKMNRNKNIPQSIKDALKANLKNIENLSKADANRVKAILKQK